MAEGGSENDFVNQNDDVIKDSKFDLFDYLDIQIEKVKKMAKHDDSPSNIYNISVICDTMTKEFLKNLNDFAVSSVEPPWKEFARCASFKHENVECQEAEYKIFGGSDRTPHYAPTFPIFQNRAEGGTARMLKYQKTTEKVVQKVNAADVDKRDGYMVNEVLKIIINDYIENGYKPICFYRLILNPNSFSTTVNNGMFVTELLKKCLAALGKDKNGWLTVEPVLSAGNEDQRDETDTHTGKKIIALKFSVPRWIELVRDLGIREARIPTEITNESGNQTVEGQITEKKRQT